MSWKRFKYIYACFFFVFILSTAASFYWMVASQPQNKPNPVVQEPKDKVFTISSDTKILVKEQYEICAKYNLNDTNSSTELTGDKKKQLEGLNIDQLKEKYEQDNIVIEHSKETVTITKTLEGLCPSHRKLWHLGASTNGEYITVYYGPGQVKNEGGIYKITEIPISNLPEDYKEKIRNYKLEFYNEDELIATLDSLSEHLNS
ncbi:MAG: hypothetical protein ACOYVD_04320 [Bacillota bacterium]